MKIGKMVALSESFLGEPEQTVCYVYEVYELEGRPGCSLITQNGVNLGGFSEEEYNEYTIPLGEVSLKYNFRNVIKLDLEFERVIKPIIDKFIKQEGLNG